MGVCSLRRRKGGHIQMDNRKKTLRLAAYHFTQISRLLLAIFILLIAADLILVGSMFIRRCQIQDPVSFQTIFNIAAAPVIFYAAYGALVAGMLFYFLRYFMDGKGVYTLRSLPMGASGLLWSMFIAMLSAMILLWAAQLLAIYLGYGLYRMEVLLYNLPGNVDGMSRIGFSVIVPDREWLPPANDLYLAFIRTPFLQLFYPRHPVFWALAVFMVVLPPISGAYSVLALCERRARALLPVPFCWGVFLIGLVEGQDAFQHQGYEQIFAIGISLVLTLFGMLLMLWLAWRRASKSRLG